MLAQKILRALDSDNASKSLSELCEAENKSSLDRWIPFVVLHALGLSAFCFGVSTDVVLLATALYWIRMFAITAFYHRYFAHRSFKTSRILQFIFAFIGTSSCQRGPLWWASHHRHHHKFSDKEEDIHSPVESGFMWSHIGWITSEKNIPTDYERIKDFTSYPELIWLNRFDWVPITVLSLVCFAIGGFKYVAWLFLSTVILFHCTCFINSLAHLAGTRRYETDDSSRNNFILALITMGEGWHNNHHKNPGSVNQGQKFWEIDLTYMILKAMSYCGLVWDLRVVK